jgi:hypothetical protein
MQLPRHPVSRLNSQTPSQPRIESYTQRVNNADRVFGKIVETNIVGRLIALQ